MQLWHATHVTVRESGRLHHYYPDDAARLSVVDGDDGRRCRQPGIQAWCWPARASDPATNALRPEHPCRDRAPTCDTQWCAPRRTMRQCIAHVPCERVVLIGLERVRRCADARLATRRPLAAQEMDPQARIVVAVKLRRGEQCGWAQATSITAHTARGPTTGQCGRRVRVWGGGSVEAGSVEAIGGGDACAKLQSRRWHGRGRAHGEAKGGGGPPG